MVVSVLNRILLVCALISGVASAERQVEIRTPGGEIATGFLTGDEKHAQVTYHWDGKDYDVALDAPTHEFVKPILAESGRRDWAVSLYGGGWHKGRLETLHINLANLEKPASPTIDALIGIETFKAGAGFAKIGVPVHVPAEGGRLSRLAPKFPEGTKGRQYVSLSIAPAYPFAVEVLAEEGDTVVVTPASLLDKGATQLLRVPKAALGRMTKEEWEALAAKPPTFIFSQHYNEFLAVETGPHRAVATLKISGERDKTLDGLRVEARLHLREGKRSGMSVIIAGAEGETHEREGKLVERDGKTYLEWAGGRPVELTEPTALDLRRLTGSRDNRFSVSENGDMLGTAGHVNTELRSIVFRVGRAGNLIDVQTEHQIKVFDFQKGREKTITRWFGPSFIIDHPFALPPEGPNTRPIAHQRYVLPYDGEKVIPITVTRRIGDRVRFVPGWQAGSKSAETTEYEMPIASLRFFQRPDRVQFMQTPDATEWALVFAAMPKQEITIPAELRGDPAKRWEYIASGAGRVWTSSGHSTERGLATTILLPGGREVRGFVDGADGKSYAKFTLDGKRHAIELTAAMHEHLRPMLAATGVTRWAVPIEGGLQNMQRSGLALTLTGEPPRAQTLHSQFARKFWNSTLHRFDEKPFNVEVRTESVPVKAAFTMSGKEKVAIALASPTSHDYYPIPLEIMGVNATHVAAARPSSIAQYRAQPWDGRVDQMIVPHDALRVVPDAMHAELVAKDRGKWSPPGEAGFSQSFYRNEPVGLPLTAGYEAIIRPRRSENAAAEEHLALQTQLALLQTVPRSEGEVPLHVVYKDSGGVTRHAQARLAKIDDGNWSVSYADAGGRTHTIRVGQPSRDGQPDYHSQLKQLFSRADGVNAVPIWPVGYSNGRLAHVALVLDERGDVKGVRAQHDYGLWDWKGNKGRGLHARRDWFDAADVRGAFAIPNLGKHPVPNQPPEAQRFVVVHQMLRGGVETFSTPIVVLTHDGRDVKVALVRDWESFSKRRTKELPVYTIDASAIRYVPDERDWQKLLTDKVDYGKVDWSASEIYMNDGRRSIVTTAPMPGIDADGTAGRKHIVTISRVVGSDARVPVFELERNGEKAKVVVWEDWRNYLKAGGGNREITTYEVPLKEMAPADDAKIAEVERFYAENAHEWPYARRDMLRFNERRMFWNPVPRFVSLFPPALFSVIRSYLADQCGFSAI